MTFPPVLTNTIARVLFALPLGIFGLLHFMNGGMMATMVPSFIPGGVFWVYVTGLALLAGAVAVIANRRFARLAALLLGVLVLIFALTIHLPGSMNPDTMLSAMPLLLRDMAIAGGAFAFAGILKE